MGYHTMEHYLTLKRKEVSMHATMQMNLENVMLAERNRPQRINWCIILFKDNFQNRQIYSDRKFLPRAWENGRVEGLWLRGAGLFFFGGGRAVL